MNDDNERVKDSKGSWDLGLLWVAFAFLVLFWFFFFSLFFNQFPEVLGALPRLRCLSI